MLQANRPLGTVAYMGGVPAVLEKFTWSWSQMQEWNSDFLPRLHYDRATISYHAAARNNLVARMQGDWIVMLDTDHEFEPDLIGRLLHTATVYDLDVLTGLYQYKTFPHQPVLFAWKDASDPLKGVNSIADWDTRLPIFTVDSAGGGCLFIRRHVIDRVVAELKQRPFDPLPPLSEDNSFFARLKTLGIKTWVDTRVESNHLLIRGLGMGDFAADMVDEGRVTEVLACEVA